MRFRHSYAIGLGVAMAAVVAAGASYATSLAVSSETAVINACRNTTNGLLRVVANNTTDCRVGEQPISWNASGPQGPAGPSAAFSVQTGNEVTIPTTPTTLLTLADVPAGKYVVIANAGINNLNGPQTVPVLCWLTAPSDIGILSFARLDPFSSANQIAGKPSGSSATTLPLTLTTELAAQGSITLRCQSNTGDGSTALIGARKITAVMVGELHD